MTKESQIEEQFIEQLKGLKYIYRPDIKGVALCKSRARSKALKGRDNIIINSFTKKIKLWDNH